jgi:hypothetical protein
MAAENALAYYDMATIMAVNFLLHTNGDCTMKLFINVIVAMW